MSDTADLATATVVAPAAPEHARKHDVQVRYEQVRLKSGISRSLTTRLVLQKTVLRCSIVTSETLPR